VTATRVLTAVVLVPLVVATVLLASTNVVALAVALVVVLALQEFFALGARVGHPGYPRWTMLCGTGLIAAPSILPESFSVPLQFFLVVFVLGAATLAMVSRRDVREALPSICASAAGLLFIAWPLSYVARLHGVPQDGRKLVLLTLAIVWVGDTAAYFLGRAFGRHKLAPVISPKKTWEGAAGNIVGAAAAAAAFQSWLQVPLVHLLGVGVAASVAGQVGDLVESAFKRSAGVKDSGTLLPGHGGMLDRVDALILAAPAVWWYFDLFVWR